MCNLDLSKWKMGCWPNNFWSIRHLFPYHYEFHTPSVKHDYFYSIWEDKEFSDKEFLRLMLETGKWKPFALFYYLMVRLLWFIFYKPNK